MLRILSICFIAFTILSCDSSESKNQTTSVGQANSLENPFVKISGIYSGQTLMADQRLVQVELTLNADSTFNLTERPAISDADRGKKMMSHTNTNTVKRTGTFSMDTENTWLKLTTNSGAWEEIYFKYSDTNLIKLDAQKVQMAEANKYVLERTSKVVGTISNFLVNYETRPFAKYPVQVFLRTAVNHIRINKPYLDQTSDAEKALLAYYILKYNTGCDLEGCRLATALGMTEEAMKAALAKWMPEVEAAKQLAANYKIPNAQERLTMLFFIKKSNGMQVNFTIMAANDVNMRGVDDFQLEGTNWKLVKESKPELVKKK